MRYLPCTYSMVLLEKLTGLQLVKKCPAFYGTRTFITALKSVRHLSVLGQPNPVHIPTSHLLVQVPNFISLCMLRDASPRNTSPPGDPGGGVVHLRNVLSPEEASWMRVFLIMNDLQGGVVSTSPNPQAGGPPLVGCLRLLIQYIRSYHPYRKLFLHPQPEDAPCRGDRDTLHTYLV